MQGEEGYTSVTTLERQVKKRSYRADGKRLKAEVDTLRARAACLGEESSSNVEEVRYWQKTAKEANKHLTE